MKNILISKIDEDNLRFSKFKIIKQLDVKYILQYSRKYSIIDYYSIQEITKKDKDKYNNTLLNLNFANYNLIDKFSTLVKIVNKYINNITSYHCKKSTKKLIFKNQKKETNKYTYFYNRYSINNDVNVILIVPHLIGSTGNATDGPNRLWCKYFIYPLFACSINISIPCVVVTVAWDLIFPDRTRFFFFSFYF